VRLHDDLVEEGAAPEHAMIDPAYPYMAIPKSVFAKFSEIMKTAYPDEPITCDTLDWCYFFTPCEDVAKSLPDFKFTVKN
jgi:hypothetical protein